MNRLVVGLRGQYLLAWMNIGTLILTTCIFSLLSVYPTIDNVFYTIKTQLDQSCLHINDTANQIHQFPYMIQSYVNAVHQSASDHLRMAIIGLITVVQTILLCWVDIYKSTYRCLLAFAVNTVMTAFVRLAAPFQEAAETVVKGIDTAADAVGSLFNNPDSSVIPTHLSNWTSSMEKAQQTVNQWTNGTDELQEWLSLPFESLKQQINASFIPKEHHQQNNASLQVSNNDPHIRFNSFRTYCNATIVTSELEDLRHKLKFSLGVVIAILCAAIVVCTLLHMLQLRYSHRYLLRLRYKVVDYLASSLPSAPATSTHAHLIDQHIPAIIHRSHISAQSAAIARYGDAHSHPVIASFVYQSQEHILQTPSLVKHWLLFLFQSTAFWYCLCLSLAGLGTTYSLLALIHSPSSSGLLSAFQQLDINTNQWVQSVVQHTESQVQQDLQLQWQSTNQWISNSEATINDKMMSAIRDFALPINATLTNVSQHLSDLITTTVGGTIMETPAKSVLDCLVINKLESLQQGVDWIIRHSEIHFPRVGIPFSHWDISSQLQTEPSKSILLALEGQLNSQLYGYWVLLSLWMICAVIGFIYVKYTRKDTEVQTLPTKPM